MITLASIMRNSASYLARYLAQVEELASVFPDLRVVIGEGDHVDQTADLLRLTAPERVEIVEVSHGGPSFGSVDHPERWDQIAKAVRKTLDAIGDPGQALIWVESDLIWKADTMLALLADIQRVSAVSPLSLAHGTRSFYDTWGYRQNGHGFNANEPYWHHPEDYGMGLLKIDSCGSCFVASPSAYAAVDTWSGHWPFRAGGNLWLDTKQEVFHP